MMDTFLVGIFVGVGLVAWIAVYLHKMQGRLLDSQATVQAQSRRIDELTAALKVTRQELLDNNTALWEEHAAHNRTRQQLDYTKAHRTFYFAPLVRPFGDTLFRN